jgi:hypothetical protein
VYAIFQDQTLGMKFNETVNIKIFKRFSMQFGHAVAKEGVSSVRPL